MAALSAIASPPALFDTAADASRCAVVQTHLDGASTLSGHAALATSRKPLKGVEKESADRHTCLLALSSDVSQTPTVKQASLARFFASKATTPPVTEAALTTPATSAATAATMDDAGPAAADQADPVAVAPAGAAGGGDNGGEGGRVEGAGAESEDVPSFAASGGTHLVVFDEMLMHVVSHEAGLLTGTERGWLTVLAPSPAQLSVAARALYVRLFVRRGVAFALSSLNYAEVGDKDATLAAARALCSAGLAQMLSLDTGTDGFVDPAAASAAIELLTGPRLKEVCVAGGLPARAPLTSRAATSSLSASFAAAGGTAVAAGGGADEQRQLLRERLGLPQAPARRQTPGFSTAAIAAISTSTSNNTLSSAVGSAARLRPSQRSSLVRKVIALLGGQVLLLTESPLAAVLRCERLFFSGSYCSGVSPAAAAAMGVHNLRAPSYTVPPPPPSPTPLVPHRDVLLRYEGSVALAAAYEASLSLGDAAGMERCARQAYTLLALVLRCRDDFRGDSSDPRHEDVAALTLRADERDAVQALLCTSEPCAHPADAPLPPTPASAPSPSSPSAVRLHACEAVGWEQLRAVRPIGARMTFGWVCAGLLTVHASWLEKRKLFGHAVFVLQQLLRSPFLPRRRGHWWSRLAIDRDHLGRTPLCCSPHSPTRT
jgi:hypothetical protein